MGVTVYRSTDASAPNLQGQSGTLITVLDAVLVNGYGSQTAAGWTKPFSGTNKAVYRMVTTSNTGFYLNVQDNAPGAGGAREARVWGYETASAQDTGTGQFPTAAQMTTGVFVRKSATADSTNRAWTIVANGSTFYMFIETGDATSPVISFPWMFGDIFATRSGDSYRCLLIARNTENSSSSQADGFASALAPNQTTFLSNVLPGHYMPRTFTAVGGSLQVGKHWDQSKMGGGAQGSGSITGTNLLGGGATIGMGFNGDNNPSLFSYPNGADDGLYVSPCWVHHSNSIRGYLKGLWVPLHDRPLTHNDTFSGSGAFAGKTFLIQNLVVSSNGVIRQGQVAIETSDTWS